MAKTVERTLTPSRPPHYRSSTRPKLRHSSVLLPKRVSSSPAKLLPNSRLAPRRPRRLSSSSFETAKSVGRELSRKTIEALRTNTEASFSHLEALVGARSLSEVMELQTTFIRKSVETAVEQAKDLQTVTTKAAEDVSKPLKAAFEKAAKELKVA